MTEFPPQGFRRLNAGVSTGGNTLGTTGTVNRELVFVGGNNITLSQSIDGQLGTITISGGAAGAGSFSAGISTGGNTLGTTGLISQQIVFVGGNNITLSQSINAQSATLTISGQPTPDFGVSTGGNTSGITGTANAQMLLAGGNNITLSQSKIGNLITVTISAPVYDFGVSTGGNTSGTTGISTRRLVLAGGNNITLSQSIDLVNGFQTVTISGAVTFAQTTQPAINAAAGTQTATSGTVVWSNSNNVSFGMSNSSVITASATFAQTTQPAINAAAGTQTATSGTVVWSNSNNVSFGMSNSSVITASFSDTGIRAAAAGTQTATSGTVVWSNSNNVSFGMSNSSVITASATFAQTVQTQNLIDVTLSGNTSGTLALVSSGTLTLAGGNNITLSQVGNAVTISAGAGGAGVGGIAAGTQTATSGTVVWSNSNNVSFGMSNSSIITASATFAQSIQTESRFNLTLGGNTSGTLTLVSSGVLTLAGGNNITLSQNANAITIMGQPTPDFGVSTGGNTSGITGTANAQMLLAGGNNITLSQSKIGNLITVTISGGNSFSAGISTGGNTSGTTGLVSQQIIFVGGNNITLSQSTNAGLATLTISAGAAAAAVVKAFAPNKAIFSQPFGQTQGDVRIQPFWIPFNMTATLADILMHISNSSSAAGTISLNIGIYTYTVSTANSLSTALRTFAYNSTLVGSSYTNISGTRYRHITLASWAFTPGDYLLAIQASIVTGLTSGTYSWFGFSTFSLNAAEYAGGNVLHWGHDGNFTVATGALPASFHISDIDRTGTSPPRQPWVLFQGTQ